MGGKQSGYDGARARVRLKRARAYTLDSVDT